MLTMETKKPAVCTIIWMHGLGADASDMQGLAEAMTGLQPAVRHVFLNAPHRPVTLNQGYVMPAWYDITGSELVDREDEEGINASSKEISSVIDTEIERGMPSERIYLAGFSQGGAMALYTALTETRPLGGAIALSAYLPLANTIKIKQPHRLPVFIGFGIHDPLVLPAWTEHSASLLQTHGFKSVSMHRYPMEHSVCLDEIRDIEHWLNHQFKETEA